MTMFRQAKTIVVLVGKKIIVCDVPCCVLRVIVGWQGPWLYVMRLTSGEVWKCHSRMEKNPRSDYKIVPCLGFRIYFLY